MDFVEICNVCTRKVIIKVVKRKINSDKICRSYSDLNFGVTFLEHSETDMRLPAYEVMWLGKRFNLLLSFCKIILSSLFYLFLSIPCYHYDVSYHSSCTLVV